MNQELADLIQKKKGQPTGGGGINWDDRRDRYLAAVSDLYRQIEAILAVPIEHATVRLERRAKSLTETFIGTYSIDDLIMLLGEEQVRFSPRGRNVAGASGRVDVIGERGEATLIVQPGRAEWSYIKSRQPTLRVVPFDDSALADVLNLVTRD